MRPDPLFALLQRGRKVERELHLCLTELESLIMERREKSKPAQVIDPRTDRPFSHGDDKYDNRPGKQEWVRVFPDEEYHMQMAMLEDELERGFYAVDRSLVGLVTQELVFKKLYYSINREGVIFLWPAKLPDSTGR
jgi:hypothetical protein